MSENPLESLLQTFLKVSNSVQTHLSQFIRFPNNNKTQPIRNDPSFPLYSLSSPSHSKRNLLDANLTGSSLLQPTEQLLKKEKTASPMGKEELGRATWTFLHTLAAQMAILSRMYPCKDCADHFKEILRSNPVQVGSHHEFSQWLCHVHNIVNRSLGKLAFPCERVDARWGKLECEQRACDLQGTTTNIGSEI